ncbi:hypothetical protein ACN20G_07305 [Streptomyces sp. BI20]|uniref:hypothetical protein n=1 Tax=Streptomyces sp. BI20 TaxID=3403460 RepID=UPI003C73A5C2
MNLACSASLSRIPQYVVATVPLGTEYERAAECELARGHDGSHADLLYEVGGFLAVWLRWVLGGDPETEAPAPYCDTRHPGDGEGCGLAVTHLGPHSWEIRYPDPTAAATAAAEIDAEAGADSGTSADSGVDAGTGSGVGPGPGAGSAFTD